MNTFHNFQKLFFPICKYTHIFILSDTQSFSVLKSELFHYLVTSTTFAEAEEELGEISALALFPVPGPPEGEFGV